MSAIARTYAADLLSIHDGDTMHFSLDLGFGVKFEHPVRLLGCNAPELSTAAGKVALAYVAQWFHDNPAPYRIWVGSDDFDKYGRVLGRVISFLNQHDLTTDLIASGNAVPMAAMEQR